MIKAGVIGLGMGQNHLYGYSQIPEVKIWAIADLDKERLKSSSQKYSVPHSFRDYRELLKLRELDVVSIALPNFLHCSVTIEALKAGKHVLVEKPMALNSQEAERMVNVAREKGRVLMVGMNFRYFSEILVLKRFIEQGEFGDIYYIKAVTMRRKAFPSDFITWFKDKEKSGGGVLMDMSPHMLDLSLWMAGDFNVTSVYGATYNKFMPVDDLACALVKLSSGVTINLEMCWEAFTETELFFFSLFGTKGGATTNPLRIYQEIRGTSVEITPEVKKNDFASSTAGEITHFINCIKEKTEPSSSGEKGLKVMRTLEAIYESARTGREVRMT